MRSSLNTIIGHKTRRLTISLQYHASKLMQHVDRPLDDVDLETVVKQLEYTARLARQELDEIKDLQTGKRKVA